MGKYLSCGMYDVKEILHLGSAIPCPGQGDVTPVVVSRGSGKGYLMTLASPADIGGSQDPRDYDSYASVVEIPGGSVKDFALELRKIADWLDAQ